MVSDNSKFHALRQCGNIMCLSHLHINTYFSNKGCFHIEKSFLVFHSYTYILTFSLPSLVCLLTPNPALCPKETKEYPPKNCCVSGLEATSGNIMSQK